MALKKYSQTFRSAIQGWQADHGVDHASAPKAKRPDTGALCQSPFACRVAASVVSLDRAPGHVDRIFDGLGGHRVNGLREPTVVDQFTALPAVGQLPSIPMPSSGASYHFSDLGLRSRMVRPSVAGAYAVTLQASAQLTR